MRHSVALHILGALTGSFAFPTTPRGDTMGIPKRRAKGQLRSAKPKASGAARLKRVAKNVTTSVNTVKLINAPHVVAHSQTRSKIICHTQYSKPVT